MRILRICRKCKNTFPLSSFPKNKSCYEGHERTCKYCGHQAASRKWRHNQSSSYLKESRLVQRLKEYRLSADEYRILFAKQSGVCAICLKPETRKSHYSQIPRQLCIDHDHKTGKIRGLLCAACNSAIGLLKEDKNLFGMASIYLGKSND